jgi:preprotein translocase subunit YajC
MNFTNKDGVKTRLITGDIVELQSGKIGKIVEVTDEKSGTVKLDEGQHKVINEADIIEIVSLVFTVVRAFKGLASLFKDFLATFKKG